MFKNLYMASVIQSIPQLPLDLFPLGCDVQIGSIELTSYNQKPTEFKDGEHLYKQSHECNN